MGATQYGRDAVDVLKRKWSGLAGFGALWRLGEGWPYGEKWLRG